MFKRLDPCELVLISAAKIETMTDHLETNTSHFDSQELLSCSRCTSD